MDGSFYAFDLCSTRRSCRVVNKLAARFRGSLLIQLYFSQGALLPDHVQPLVSADGVTVFSRLLRIQGAGQSRETRNDTGARNQISVAGL